MFNAILIIFTILLLLSIITNSSNSAMVSAKSIRPAPRYSRSNRRRNTIPVNSRKNKKDSSGRSSTNIIKRRR